MPFDEQRALNSPSGAMLNLHVKNTRQDARAVVQINHGLAEHAGRYGPFADFLSSHGFHVYAHDHRGHGGTEAADAPKHMFAWRDGAMKVVADAAAVHKLIAREHPDLPIVLFGQSLGGLIALSFLAKEGRPPVGVAIWNCDPDYRLSVRAARILLAWERFRLGSDAPSRFLPRFTFDAWADAIPHRRAQFDWLSRDPVAVDAFIADPLCGWPPTISLWSDVIGLMAGLSRTDAFATMDRALPFHLLGGGADPATGYGRGMISFEKRLRQEGFSNLTSRIYAENRHDCLNDFDSREIMADFADWIDRLIGEKHSNQTPSRSRIRP